jgi:hypothetical protein
MTAIFPFDTRYVLDQSLPAGARRYKPHPLEKKRQKSNPTVSIKKKISRQKMTLSSPARRASQDSSTPAIQLGLPPLPRPAIVLPLFMKEKAIKHREDATRRQTRESERAETETETDREQRKTLMLIFSSTERPSQGLGVQLGDPGARAIQVV